MIADTKLQLIFSTYTCMSMHNAILIGLQSLEKFEGFNYLNSIEIETKTF